jgi:tRNA pseudouridine38-40 synthase
LGKASLFSFVANIYICPLLLSGASFMPRYFLELAYKGTAYAGFQIQENAPTVQAEVEKALAIFFRQQIELTGSSRTDAGVHAWQNFFHFNADIDIPEKSIYNLNAILPTDIVLKSLRQVADSAHCRFDAQSRTYQYQVYQQKNPFLQDQAYFFPYPLDLQSMNAAAATLLQHKDFTSFSKRNTQTFTNDCSIVRSEWLVQEATISYWVEANRFLRGMVRGLVGTMLKVGVGKMTVAEFEQVILAKDCAQADFSTPGHGLFLSAVKF